MIEMLFCCVLGKCKHRLALSIGAHLTDATLMEMNRKPWSHTSSSTWKPTNMPSASSSSFFTAPGSEPISSHLRILISSMAQWEIIDTAIIHLSCLNVNPMLGSLRIHHVIQGIDGLFTTCWWSRDLITAVIQGAQLGPVKQWWIRCVGAREVRDSGRSV